MCERLYYILQVKRPRVTSPLAPSLVGRKKCDLLYFSAICHMIGLVLPEISRLRLSGLSGESNHLKWVMKNKKEKVAGIRKYVPVRGNIMSAWVSGGPKWKISYIVLLEVSYARSRPWDERLLPARGLLRSAWVNDWGRGSWAAVQSYQGFSWPQGSSEAEMTL